MYSNLKLNNIIFLDVNRIEKIEEIEESDESEENQSNDEQK